MMMFTAYLKRLLLCLALLHSAACQINNSAQSLHTPTTNYLIPYTQIAPVIDGKLDDSVWASAPATQDFVIHDTGQPAPVRTHAQLLYDDAYLYLGFTTTDADIYAHYTETTDPLFFRDDLVEIFIDPFATGHHYLEFGASANANHYSITIPKATGGEVKPIRTGPIDIRAATHIGGTLNNPNDKDEGWSVEIRIALASIQTHTTQKNSAQLKLPIQPGTTWKMGLFRIDYDHTTPYKEAKGYYSWQHLGAFGFHRPTRFGTVEFGPQ